MSIILKYTLSGGSIIGENVQIFEAPELKPPDSRSLEIDMEKNVSLTPANQQLNSDWRGIVDSGLCGVAAVVSQSVYPNN